MAHPVSLRVAVRATVTVLAMVGAFTRPALAQNSDLTAIWKAAEAAGKKAETPAAKPKADTSAKKVADAVAAKPVAAATLASAAKPVAPAGSKKGGEAHAVPSAVDSNAARANSMTAALRAQADTIAALRASLAAAPAAAKAPDAAATAIAIMTAKVDSLARVQAADRKQAALVEQRTAQKLAGLGNFKFSGDIRARFEDVQQNTTPTRYRERARARFNISGDVNAEFAGGISVSTGSSTDHQSENQTATGFFTRKTLSLETFWVGYKPTWAPGASVTVGKFNIPWQKTTLTFSGDMQVDGTAVAFQKSLKSGPLASFGMVGVFLPLLEVANGGDSYISGGQLQTSWRISPKARFRIAGGVFDFSRPDSIATAIVAGAVAPSLPNANGQRKDASGKVIGYTTGFQYQELIGGFDVPLSARWPVSINGDYVSNVRARNAEKVAYMVEVKAGVTAKPGDAQFAYMYYRIGRDAVLGAFNETDLRAATNVINHRFQTNVKLQSNVTAGLNVFVGRVADTRLSPSLVPVSVRPNCALAIGCRDPWTTRIQADLTYVF